MLTTFKARTTLIVMLLALLLVLSISAMSALAQDSLSPFANEFDSTMSRDWFMLTYQLVRDEAINAPAASRVYAYTAVGLYESVVPGMPENFSIGGQVAGLPPLPFTDEGQIYDWPSSANASISTVLHGMFAESGEDIHARIDALRAEKRDERLAEVSADVVDASMVFGDEIGNAIVDWSAEDYYGPTRKQEYVLPTGDPSLWVPTAPGMQALEPFWGTLRPFGMWYPEQCNVPIGEEFSTDPNSVFYKQAAEVMLTGDRLTNEQREIARFWLDTPGVTGTPSGHWVLIETQVIEDMDLPLGRSAEIYMLTNAAVADAFISSWNLKYQVNLLRPVTYIQEYIRPNWNPYIQAPPFPEYPSGHSVGSGAASEVLTTMLGQVALTDRTPIINGHEQIQRSFTSFEAAATEAAISRMYGGIHYRAAIELGLRQGRCVGQAVLNNIRLRSIPQGE